MFVAVCVGRICLLRERWKNTNWPSERVDVSRVECRAESEATDPTLLELTTSIASRIWRSPIASITLLWASRGKCIFEPKRRCERAPARSNWIEPVLFVLFVEAPRRAACVCWRAVVESAANRIRYLRGRCFFIAARRNVVFLCVFFVCRLFCVLFHRWHSLVSLHVAKQYRDDALNTQLTQYKRHYHWQRS